MSFLNYGPGDERGDYFSLGADPDSKTAPDGDCQEFRARLSGVN